ncbi:MAG TPA: hypothetical protein VLM76_05665 [Patescibacteria group bacterium]|nr:hypothetical protein [Patescibacteria group bacterium]
MKSMQAQLDELARSAPAQRIELREPLLAHGAAVVAPLADLAAADPALGPSVTAWLEVLGKRDEEAHGPVVAALRTLATSAQDDTRRHAAEALARFGVPLTARARRPVAPKR